MRPLLRLAIACLAFAGAAPLAAQGKPLKVGTQRIRDLAAGTVLPGVPLVITPADPTRSGQLTVSGARSTPVQCSFLLPAALTGPAGAQMPVTFTAGSVATSLSGTTADLVPRDPRTSFSATLSDKGRLFVYIGGTLLPTSAQSPGAYTTPISLTCIDTGP